MASILFLPESAVLTPSLSGAPGWEQINGSNHQRQTVTDSAYAKPNKAVAQPSSPLPPLEPSQSPQQQTSSRIHISETRTSHHYQPQYEAHTATAQSVTHIKQNQLDSMLGNLQADMSRQGVNTTQKGCCNACEKPIVGQVYSPSFLLLSFSLALPPSGRCLNWLAGGQET